MMKRALFTILALCGLFVGLQAQNTNTTNQNGVTATGQLDTVRNTRVQPVLSDGPALQTGFVSPTGEKGNRPRLARTGQRLKAVIKVTSSSIVNNSVSDNTATIAATVSDSGDYALPIIERGVCYATTANPTLLTATKVADNTISGKGYGNFNVSLSGLQPNTAYHARAYAVSMYDTVYGEDLTVTTVTTVTMQQTPLTFEATSDGTTITFKNEASGPVTYTVNGGSAQTIASNNTGNISVDAGDRVCFYGDNATYSKITVYSPEPGYEEISVYSSTISCSADCYVYGNIMSLISSSSFSTATELTGDYAFSNLFEDYYKSKYIKNHATKHLVLPATTLTAHCYEELFRNCENLTTPPALPATTLAESCYKGMFLFCDNLTSTPALPATTLAKSCYEEMFYSCKSLTSAPVLPATTLADYCYFMMFDGCTNLSAAPALPATTLTNHCYSQMFNRCTSLTLAPELPATTLAPYCYNNMFRETGLTTAPDLPVKTLAADCYSQMFRGCASLTAAPDTLPATTLASSCYNQMFYECPVLTTAPVLPATTLEQYCYYQMFYNCSSLNSVTCYATSGINSNNSTNDWLKGVDSEGTFTAASTIWPISTSGIPSGWTKILDLSKVTSNQTIPDSWIITNTLAGNYKISIADGATMTINKATITYASNGTDYAGLTCLGDATIVLADGTTNTVVSGLDGDGYNNWPGIYVPQNKTLTINGNTGILNAHCGQDSYGGSAAGIGCGFKSGSDCGNIIINGGVINAYGGAKSAGIGGVNKRSCGSITINGGTVTAIGDSYGSDTGYGAGIGTGGSITGTATVTCGDITITGGTVTATGGRGGAGIGTGHSGGSVAITCGNITISGGTVIATGGGDADLGYEGAAAIGTGCKYTTSTVDNKCGNITITTGVTRVTATKGSSHADNSIGTSGSNNTCGTVILGDATVYNGSAWSPNPMVAGNYGGLTLAISTTTNTNDTWTLTPLSAPAGVVAVDLGLPSGTLWASCNIGATSPEEFGDYFAWGATEAWYSSQSPLTWKTGKETGYSWADAPYYTGNGTSHSWSKYTGSDYTTLQTTDDAAIANWGSSWRMPTQSDFNELLNNTDCTWETNFNNSGIDGFKCANKTNPSVYIFLPGAGRYEDGTLKASGEQCHYWASTYQTNETYKGNYMFCNNNFTAGLVTSYFRSLGMSIRPVRSN